jgi:hypothetical protein
MASDSGSSLSLIVRAATAALLSFALLLPANAQVLGKFMGLAPAATAAAIRSLWRRLWGYRQWDYWGYRQRERAPSPRLRERPREVEKEQPPDYSHAPPRAAIKKELEEVNANKTIANNEKKKLLRELNEALKSAEPIQFPTNIELVMKYYDKIDATTIAVHDGSDSHPTSSAVRAVSE